MVDGTGPEDRSHQRCTGRTDHFVPVSNTGCTNVGVVPM